MPSDNLINIIDVSLAQDVVQPCWNLNRGINNAARQGNAPFRLDVTFVYMSQGKIQTEAKSTKISDTKEIGPFDNKSVVIEGSFNLAAKPDQNSNITATTQIEHGDPPAQDPIGDPISGTFPV